MEKDIYSLTILLKEKINQQECVIRLNELEKEMNNNDEVISLAYQKDLKASNYSDVLNHFNKDSKEANEALKALYEAKKKLESHPLVREYLKTYQQVRELYDHINNELFTPLKWQLCGKEHQ